LVNLDRAVAGQAKADASSAAAQYHHANADTAARPAMAGAVGVRASNLGSDTGTPDVTRRDGWCQMDRPFLLDQQALLPNNGLEPCTCVVLASSSVRVPLRSPAFALRRRTWASTRSVPGWWASAAPCSMGPGWRNSRSTSSAF